MSFIHNPGVSVGTINGILKADGSGGISGATAGTDYLQPTGNGSGLSGVLKDATAFATAAQGATADSALQPNGDGSELSGVLTTLSGHSVSELANDAKYLVSPFSTTNPGDMIYTEWSDSSPGAVMTTRLPIGTAGQVLAVATGWQNGTGLFPTWIDPVIPTASAVLTASSITPVADGTYTVGIGTTTNGTITISGGIITAIQEAS